MVTWIAWVQAQMRDLRPAMCPVGFSPFFCRVGLAGEGISSGFELTQYGLLKARFLLASEDRVSCILGWHQTPYVVEDDSNFWSSSTSQVLE